LFVQDGTGVVTTANASCIGDGVGLRIMAHLAHAFAVDQRNARYHLGAAYMRGGQGITVTNHDNV